MSKKAVECFLSPKALFIIENLERNGFEAFAVGGCVRDFLMGKNYGDVDIATNALPSQIKIVFCDFNTIDIGEKYGTIAVIFDDEQFEITTYRTDNAYYDNRHPESVSFSRSIDEDLKRRDFTMNSLAYNPRSGIIDIFGGKEDIKNGIIRCVGEPNRRFSEDALRIMRAVRFASVLGFDIESNTKTALFECAEMLKNVSAPRLRDELCKLVCGENVSRILIEYADILAVFIPEIEPCIGFCQHSVYHKYDVWEHIAYAVGSAKCNLETRLAALFHDIAKPRCFELDENGAGHFKGHASDCADCAETIMKRLCFSSKQIDKVSKVIYYHSDMNYTEKSIKRRISKIGFDGFEMLLDLQHADNSAKHEFCKERLDIIRQWRRLAKDLEKNDACLSRSKLSVNGNDLLKIGLSGKAIGNTLEMLLELVIDEKIENEPGVLIERAKELNDII